MTEERKPIKSYNFDVPTILAIMKYNIDHKSNNNALSHQIIHRFKKFANNFQSFNISGKWVRWIDICASNYSLFTESKDIDTRQKILNTYEITRLINKNWNTSKIDLISENTTNYLTNWVNVI